MPERQFEWDAAKSAHNASLRGLPFDLAMALFDGLTLESEDNRRNYGEIRMLAVGEVAGRILTCVYIDRAGAVRRIISLRRANGRERNEYRATYPG